jgi:hypothetical protein
MNSSVIKNKNSGKIPIVLPGVFDKEAVFN